MILARFAGAFLIATVLWEAFETIVLPQRTLRQLRLARIFYVATWRLWLFLSRAVRRSRQREIFLALFGPLAVLMLLVMWGVALIIGFALIDWTIRDQFSLSAPMGIAGWIYYSGASFFTVGANDISARTMAARFLTIAEAGIGFGFLAVTITYLPVLYGAFSRRERNISMLDARAGSPPTALELLRNYSRGDSWKDLERFLGDWEGWAADLLETHMSYPLLGFFRSQHHNQSWVGSLVAILDACSWMLAAAEDFPERQTQLTFAMCRHALVDLAQVFHVSPEWSPKRPITAQVYAQLVEQLGGSCLRIKDSAARREHLEALVGAYEPFAHALAARFALALPDWIPKSGSKQNWSTSAWGPVQPEVLKMIQTGGKNR